MELTTPLVSAKSNSRRKSNSNGLLLTKSGRVSMSSNEVNAKYDASYRNSDNTNKLLGGSLSITLKRNVKYRYHCKTYTSYEACQPYDKTQRVLVFLPCRYAMHQKDEDHNNTI